MPETKQTEEENNLKLKRFNEIDDTKSKNDLLIQCKISKDYDTSISCEFFDKEFTSMEFGGTGIEFAEIREINYSFDKFEILGGGTNTSLSPTLSNFIASSG